jgi:Transposase DDE domain
VLSLVDPEARHGHKTSAHGFDGYKGHIAADPDSEIITAAEVGPGNTGDAAMAAALLADLPAPSGQDATPAAEHDHHTRPAAERPCQPAGTDAPAPTAYGDSAYGTGALLADLEGRGVVAMLKVAPATAPDGRYAIPARAWQQVSCGTGAKGHRYNDWAFIRLDHDPGLASSTASTG